MEYIFENGRPIYLQLVEKVREEIVSGKLKQGERLLSVRELAVKFKVNPNTMQKALAELEDEKLVYTERTNGKFVTWDANLIYETKQKLAKEKIKNLLNDMENIGITHKETLDYLQSMEVLKDGAIKM